MRIGGECVDPDRQVRDKVVAGGMMIIESVGIATGNVVMFAKSSKPKGEISLYSGYWI